jgi:hypothetical protein
MEEGGSSVVATVPDADQIKRFWLRIVPMTADVTFGSFQFMGPDLSISRLTTKTIQFLRVQASLAPISTRPSNGITSMCLDSISS